MKCGLRGAVILALTIACGRAPATLSDVRSAAIRDSVQALLQSFRTQTAAQEWDSVARLYADDARFRWVEDGVVRYRSAAAVRQALAALPRNVRVETSYRDTEIFAVAPGVASVVTGFETKFTDSTGTAFSFGGVITMTVVHLDGGWRFLTGHTSSPKPRGP